MNEFNKNSYKTIFDVLLENGYSEQEAEKLICDVIEDQNRFTDYADRIHTIIIGMNSQNEIINTIETDLKYI